MNILIKPWEGCFKLPEYKTAGAAGADCYVAENVFFGENSVVKVPLGFAIELPPHFAAFILPRSSSFMSGLHVTGLIDSDYRGQVFASVSWEKCAPLMIRRGERICQMVIQIIARTEFAVVDQLSETQRGEAGFGSTGNA